MRLVHLEVERFQCIEKAELELGPGLNVLYGPNDLGKSSLAWAIRAVLLLQHNSVVHERFVSWCGDGEPRVALTIADDDERLWRVTKTFGGGSAGRSRLESSRDRRTFTTEATGREVDDRLRAMFRWGVQKPGGQGPRGLPESFLTQVLLAEQDSVRKVLFDTSLENDPDEAGRLRMVEALGALAQDPLFKRILDDTQARVDTAFTPKGRKKRTADSPFLAIVNEQNDLQAKQDDLTRRVRETEAADAKIRDLASERDRINTDLEEANEALRAARADLVVRERRAQLEAQLKDHEATIGGARELQERIDRLVAEGAQVRAAASAGEAAVREADGEATEAERALDAARGALDVLTHADVEQERRMTEVTAARDGAMRRVEAAERALAEATAALKRAEKIAAEVKDDAAAALRLEHRAGELERAVATARDERAASQQALERAKDRVREAHSAAKVQARALAQKEVANQRLQRRAARADAEARRKAAIEARDAARRASDAVKAVEAQKGEADRAAERAVAASAALAIAERGVERWRQLELVAAYREARATAAQLAKEEAAVADARAKAAELRETAATLRGSVAPGLPTAAEIAGLRELHVERRTAEARLGGGLTVTLRRKQPLPVTWEADGEALATPAGRAAVVVVAKQVLRLELGDLAELEVTAGEEDARRAATALRERWRQEAEPVLAAHGVAGVDELDARRREADEREREADRLERDASAQDERASRRPASGDLGAAEARRDELAAELSGADLEKLGDELSRLGDRWQASLKQQRDRSGASRDAAVGALEQARALAQQGQAELERLRTEAARLEAEAVRRGADLGEDWATVVDACDRALTEIDAAFLDLDRQEATLGAGGDDDQRAADAALRDATKSAEACATRYDDQAEAWQQAREAAAAAASKLEGTRARARELAFAEDWAPQLASSSPVLPLARWQLAVSEATGALDAARAVCAQAERQLTDSQAARAAAIQAARGAVKTAEEAFAKARDLRARRQDALKVAGDRSHEVELALKQAQLELAQSNVDAARQAATELRGQLAALPTLARSTDVDGVAHHEQQVARLTGHLSEANDDLAKARGALEHVGGAIVREQLREVEQALQQARERARQVELEYDAWKLLLETLRASESSEGAHLGRALAGPVSRRFGELTSGRYGNLELGAHLDATGLRVAGEVREIRALSAGTQDQLATLLRLCIAEQLRSAIVLDDHLSQSDPARVAWFNAVLRSAAQHVQIILITCRPAELLSRDEFQRAGEPAFVGAAGLLRSVDLTGVIRRFP